MTIPSPSVLHFRLGYTAIKDVYPDIDEYFDDPPRAYKKAVHAFYAAGCRYLQFDDTVWAYLCDRKQRTGARGARRRRWPAAGALRAHRSTRRSRPGRGT